jgi:hypothetical protein
MIYIWRVTVDNTAPVPEVGGSLLRHKMVNVDGRWKVCGIVRNREKRR